MSTRERLVEATADLFRRRGYAGTGVKQITEAARAPFGSMYHFFPDGKEELGAETLRWSGAVYGELIGLFFTPGADPVESTRRFFVAAADTVRDSDFVDACPIATVALEMASTSELMRVASADVFESWLAALDQRFVAAGLTRRRARHLSVSVFCLLEGAFLLARATRDEGHIRTAGRTAADAVSSELTTRADQIAARRR